jgi:glyoxylase-like metal-dependent hydrolase (beta-lactamase superfamily II)
MVEIIKNIHSIDNLAYPIPGVGIVSYVYIEDQNDLTLVDTCFSSDISKLENHLTSIGYEMKNIKRIILTHLHVDHVQAVNEIKRKSGARLYSHWTDAAFLANNPPYQGPPYPQAVHELFVKYGLTMKQVLEKFGSLDRESIAVDEKVSDGDTRKS